jgi:hypothetical protein
VDQDLSVEAKGTEESQMLAEGGTMQVSWSGVVVFAAFCLMLWVAMERPAFTPVAEIVATVLIALGITGVMAPTTEATGFAKDMIRLWDCEHPSYVAFRWTSMASTPPRRSG